MESSAAFSRGKQSGNVRHLRIRINADTTHHVVRRWSDFHCFYRDVDVRELLELVIHARELLLDVFAGVGNAVLNPGDIQKHATMRAPAAIAHFSPNAASHMIPCKKFRWPASVLVSLRVTPTFFFCIGSLIGVCRRNVVKHETAAVLVPEDSSFASNTFGDQ